MRRRGRARVAPPWPILAALALSACAGQPRALGVPAPETPPRVAAVEPPAVAPELRPCAAGLGHAICGDRCVSLERDAAHCGACGVMCAADEHCTLGLCLPGSAEGLGPALPVVEAGHWRAFGPTMGGRLTGIIARRHGAGERLVVGSPGGGLWRSDDGGASWSRAAARGLGDASVVHLELDRRDPQRVYVATYGGLYATTDDGDTVVRLAASDAAAAVPPMSLNSDPRAFAQLSCADGTTRVFHGPPCGGLQVSSQSGDAGTFRVALGAPSGETQAPACLVAIAADEATGRVYVSDADGREGPPRIFASRRDCSWCDRDCGAAGGPGPLWERVAGRGLPDTSVSPAGLGWTGAAGRLSLVVQDAAALRMRAFETVDGGTSWRRTGELPVTGANPNDRFLHWAGGDRLFWGSVEAFTSPDRGRSWSVYDVLHQHADVRAIFASEALGRVYNVTDGTLADQSAFNVARWRWRGPAFDPECEAGAGPLCEAGGVGHTGLDVLQPFHATAGSGERTYLGTMDNGVVCTDDGETWKPVPSLLGGDAIALVIHPVRKSVAYAVTNGGWLRADDADASDCAAVTFGCPEQPAGSAQCRGIRPFQWSANALAVDPRGAIAGHSGGHDVVATLRGTQVAVTIDGGVSWLEVARPSADSVHIDASGYLYAGTRAGLYRCTRTLPAFTDYCRRHEDWEPFGLEDRPPARILGLRVARGRDGTATYFAATTSGLFRGRAAGDARPETWELVTGGKGTVVGDVEIAPGSPGCIYAGVGFVKSLVQRPGGVRFSADGGDTWRALTVGAEVHATPIADVVTRGPGRIGVAAYGRGYWEYDWGPRSPVCPPG